jgi:hypothetical protein
LAPCLGQQWFVVLLMHGTPLYSRYLRQRQIETGVQPDGASKHPPRPTPKICALMMQGTQLYSRYLRQRQTDRGSTRWCHIKTPPTPKISVVISKCLRQRQQGATTKWCTPAPLPHHQKVLPTSRSRRILPLLLHPPRIQRPSAGPAQLSRAIPLTQPGQ